MARKDLEIWDELLPTLTEQARQDLTDLRNVLMDNLRRKCPDNSRPIGVGGATEMLIQLVRRGHLPLTEKKEGKEKK